MHEGTLTRAPGRRQPSTYDRTEAQLDQGGFPATEAAELVCLLLSERAAGISGRLISAQWDPWREDEFLDRLRADPPSRRCAGSTGSSFTASGGD